jgi:hypothetical protein
MIIPRLTFRYIDPQGRIDEYNLLSGKKPLTTLSARRRDIQDALDALADDDPDWDYWRGFYSQLLEQIDSYLARRGDVTFEYIPDGDDADDNATKEAG